MTNILLCDDSSMILNMLTKRLTEAGFNVVAKGKDGEEGIRLYNEHKPDLMLLDITMPNKDGRQCLEEIMAAYPSAKIIMVSALLDQEIKASCLQHGAKAFVNKAHLGAAESFAEFVLPVIHSVLQIGAQKVAS